MIYDIQIQKLINTSLHMSNVVSDNVRHKSQTDNSLRVIQFQNLKLYQQNLIFFLLNEICQKLSLFFTVFTNFDFISFFIIIKQTR